MQSALTQIPNTRPALRYGVQLEGHDVELQGHVDKLQRRGVQLQGRGVQLQGRVVQLHGRGVQLQGSNVVAKIRAYTIGATVSANCKLQGGGLLKLHRQPL